MSEPPVYLRGKPQYVTIYKKPKRKTISHHYSAPKIYQLPTNLYNYNQHSSTSQLGDNYAIGSSVGGESSQQQHQYAPASAILPLQTLADYGANSGKSGAIAQLALAIPASTTSSTTLSSLNIKQANQNLTAPSSLATIAGSSSSLASAATNSAGKDKEVGNSRAALAPLINFNDYDDETGAYYLARLPSALRGSRDLAKYYTLLQRADKESSSSDEHDASEHDSLDRSESQTSPLEQAAQDLLEELQDLQEQQNHESDQADHDDGLKVRTKRQVSYSSNYEQPCEGFPLEVNINSRVKLNERIFPIFGKSQIKKCVKKLQLFPPVQDHPYPQQEHY